MCILFAAVAVFNLSGCTHTVGTCGCYSGSASVEKSTEGGNLNIQPDQAKKIAAPQ